MTQGRYSRVYWSVIDDERFATVWDDDRALACWLRLLIAADAVWPSSAILPLGTNRKALDVLVRAGLVELAAGARYRIHGLDAERERRAGSARAAASARWADAPAMQTHSRRSAELVLAEQSKAKDEQSRAEQDEDDVLDSYYRLTGSFPGKNVEPWLVDLARTYGSRDVCAALGAAWIEQPDRATLLGRAQTSLKLDEHRRRKAADVARREREEREKAKIEEMPPEQRAANMERLRQMLAGSGLVTNEGVKRADDPEVAG